MIRLIGNNVVYYRNDTSDWKQRGILYGKWYVWLETTWYMKDNGKMIRLIGNNVVYYINDTSDWKQRGILYKWYVWLETTWYIIEMGNDTSDWKQRGIWWEMIRLIGNNVVYYMGNDTSDWKQRGILYKWYVWLETTWYII